MSSITCFPPSSSLYSYPEKLSCKCSADEVVSSTSAKLFHRHLHADSAWTSTGEPDRLRELSQAAIARRDSSDQGLSSKEMLARSQLINVVGGQKCTMPDVNPAIILDVAKRVFETSTLSEERCTGDSGYEINPTLKECETISKRIFGYNC